MQWRDPASGCILAAGKRATIARGGPGVKYAPLTAAWLRNYRHIRPEHVIEPRDVLFHHAMSQNIRSGREWGRNVKGHHDRLTWRHGGGHRTTVGELARG